MDLQILIDSANFASNIQPFNRIITALADLVMPTTQVKAACSGCGQHCSYFCDSATGTIYELFRSYYSTCEYTCSHTCKRATNMTC